MSRSLFSNTFSSSQKTATFISTIIEPACAIFSIYHKSGQLVSHNVLSQSSLLAAKTTRTIFVSFLNVFCYVSPTLTPVHQMTKNIFSFTSLVSSHVYSWQKKKTILCLCIQGLIYLILLCHRAPLLSKNTIVSHTVVLADMQTCTVVYFE